MSDEKVMTMAEWRGLSAESRHKLAVLGADAETLAALVLTLFDTAAYKEMWAGPIRAEVERLARKLAQKTVNLGSGAMSRADAAPMPTGTLTTTHNSGHPYYFELKGSAAQTGEPGNGHFEPVDGGE